MYDPFISSSMLTGCWCAAISVIFLLAPGSHPRRVPHRCSPSAIQASGSHSRRRFAGGGTHPPRVRRRGLLDVEILDVERVVLDELPARFDLVAHERREHEIRFGVIFGAHLQKR